jgi:hypothetical protein
LADAGFTECIADYHRGDYYDMKVGPEQLPAWVARQPWSKVQADVNTHVIPFLKSRGCTKFGGMGNCWGSYPVVHLAGDGVIDAGMTTSGFDHEDHTNMMRLRLCC